MTSERTIIVDCAICCEPEALSVTRGWIQYEGAVPSDLIVPVRHGDHGTFCGGDALLSETALVGSIQEAYRRLQAHQP